MKCGYWERHECRSCALIEVPRPRQLSDKASRARAAVGENALWTEPFAGPEAAYRNKAKMVVGGTSDAPTLGILDAEQQGVDLQACGILDPAITAALPAFARFIRLAAMIPYDIRERRGELKHVIVTTSPRGELMARFVLRSSESILRIRKHLPTLLSELPSLSVVTVNLLPAHAALLEGDEEILLTTQSELVMPVAGIELRLPPRAFFQTNTPVAAALYAQARDWVGGARTVWDLYCGVGGFALALAARGRRVIGVESSADAIAAATRTAGAAGLVTTQFIADDATAWAVRQSTMADLVVVNPPRRGLGAELAGWLEHSGIETVIYSSCNPDTLALDLERMPSLRPTAARLFDMFPQTEHLEVMARLERVVAR